jgi:hypothetical protein
VCSVGESIWTIPASTEEFPEELLERGARLMFESGRPISQVAADLGLTAEAHHASLIRTQPTQREWTQEPIEFRTRACRVLDSFRYRSLE